MQKIINILMLVLVLAQIGCVKDPFTEFEEGDWNNERSILSIRFENQVGAAEILRDGDETGSINIGINVGAVPDLSSITLNGLVLSYGAESSVQVGEALNFENATNTTTIMVTSPTGKTREYIITAEPFVETILGTYDITNLIVFGGTGPEWGGGAVLPMTDKPWIWPENGGPSAELDNTITLELEGFTDEGNSFGTIINNAGPDEMYADFQFVLDPPTDVNHFYRKIPKGEGTWERNYATGTVRFTFADGTITTGTFIENGATEDLDNGLSKTVENYAFAFNLEGTDDWDNIYTDYDKFVKRPRRFWIEMQKQ